ncbi:DDE-type integrase/transposase/recombinase, partial [Lacticaseibacillus paracasei]|uniref:DDE-type integrase/transposase/recombinase n=1 Tax=Lacticaseibacillus paracasei TaxID=1597 RepID=UPI00235DD62B
GKDNKQRLRLSAVKNLHDHSVIAWCVAPTETADLATKTMKLAIENNDGIKPDTVHSDQGTAYTSGSADDTRPLGRTDSSVNSLKLYF